MSLSNKLIVFLLGFLPSCFFLNAQDFRKGETFTHAQLILEYQGLALQYEEATLMEIGQSDIGLPIHLFVLSKEHFETLNDLKHNSAVKILINNGIHPGEACGIEASLELVKDLLKEKTLKTKDVIVAVIPVYNIGGMLNRGSYSRANQKGPNEYGFRGNAKNLDLNRDFIKMDSKNAKAFVKTFQSFDPDIFIDTHTTNGSDHQYTLTVISSQKDKMSPIMSEFNTSIFQPHLFESMKEKGFEITPYIYPLKKIPEKGLHSFLETPRFSSGYANLFNCLSFITEAHVFKPFKDRVIQTKAFLKTSIELSHRHAEQIKDIRRKADQFDLNRKVFPLKWSLDTTAADTLLFKGYKSEYVKSKVTDLNILRYRKDQPETSIVKYYNSYNAIDSANAPSYYLIPQAYDAIISRLKQNKVSIQQISKDTIIEVKAYKIHSYQTVKSPYEGHYLHYNIETKEELISKQCFKGDYIVSCQQEHVRFIIETLEPRAHDSYFAWNFFDHILQQKEWFSDYAFEPKADSILNSNKALRERFESKKQSDSSFANNSFQQLYFIYKQSNYYEKTVNLYPIYRIE